MPWKAIMEYMPVPALNAEDIRLAKELMASTHAGDSVRVRDWFFDNVHRYPGFQREHIRIIKSKGEVASVIRITPDIILLGEARIRMGGIGWVSTNPKYRNKGLCRILMHDAMEYMRKSGYHVSMLFGIPDFYHKFGFTTTLANYSVSINTADALGFSMALRLKKAGLGDIPALHRLHTLCNTDIACSIMRLSAHFHYRWERWSEWYALNDTEGRTEAYFIASADGDCLNVDDVGVADAGLCPAVIGAAAQLASDASATLIRFHVPPSHPLARYLVQFRTTHEMRLDRDAGGMMAFINKPELFETLIPEWESLLSQDLAREYRTEFTLIVGETPWRVRANKGAIDVAAAAGSSKVSVDEAELMHLITGYRHLEDILRLKRCILAPEARRLMGVVFPKRTPYVWRYDHF